MLGQKACFGRSESVNSKFYFFDFFLPAFAFALPWSAPIASTLRRAISSASCQKALPLPAALALADSSSSPTDAAISRAFFGFFSAAAAATSVAATTSATAGLEIGRAHV